MTVDEHRAANKLLLSVKLGNMVCKRKLSSAKSADGNIVSDDRISYFSSRNDFLLQLNLPGQ